MMEVRGWIGRPGAGRKAEVLVHARRICGTILLNAPRMAALKEKGERDRPQRRHWSANVDTDLIPWRRLLERLHAGLDRKLTLISAQAGAGKATLLAQWLADADCPDSSACGVAVPRCASPTPYGRGASPGPLPRFASPLWGGRWLSLDEHDNDLVTF